MEVGTEAGPVGPPQHLAPPDPGRNLSDAPNAPSQLALGVAGSLGATAVVLGVSIVANDPADVLDSLLRLWATFTATALLIEGVVQIRLLQRRAGEADFALRRTLTRRTWWSVWERTATRVLKRAALSAACVALSLSPLLDPDVKPFWPASAALAALAAYSLGKRPHDKAKRALHVGRATHSPRRNTTLADYPSFAQLFVNREGIAGPSVAILFNGALGISLLTFASALNDAPQQIGEPVAWVHDHLIKPAVESTADATSTETEQPAGTDLPDPEAGPSLNGESDGGDTGGSPSPLGRAWQCDLQTARTTLTISGLESRLVEPAIRALAYWGDLFTCPIGVESAGRFRVVLVDSQDGPALVVVDAYKSLEHPNLAVPVSADARDTVLSAIRSSDPHQHLDEVMRRVEYSFGVAHLLTYDDGTCSLSLRQFGPPSELTALTTLPRSATNLVLEESERSSSLPVLIRRQAIGDEQVRLDFYRVTSRATSTQPFSGRYSITVDLASGVAAMGTITSSEYQPCTSVPDLALSQR